VVSSDHDGLWGGGSARSTEEAGQRPWRKGAEQGSLFDEGYTAAPEAENTVSTKLAELGQRARREARLTNVIQFVDEELLRLAFRSMRKQAAPGVDGQRYEDYAANLPRNLRDLYARLKSGRYRAPVIRRVYIPKANGKRRPIGIGTVSAYNRGTPALFGFTGCHPPVPPIARAGIGRVVRAQVGWRPPVCV
jgi:hypothetical protein